MYRAANAFVLPTHGEGWGRPIMEAMAMQLPVIATNWSGQTAYMNDWNAFPIPVSAYEPCELEPQLNWATINTSALRTLMRTVRVCTCTCVACLLYVCMCVRLCVCVCWMLQCASVTHARFMNTAFSLPMHASIYLT